MWLVTVNQTYYTIRGHNKRRGRNKIKLICIVRPGQAGPDTHTDSKSKLGPLSFTASLNRNEYIKVNVISTIYGVWFYGDWVWHGHYHSIPPSLVRLHCGSVTGHTVDEGLNFYNVMNILLSLEDISHFLLSKAKACSLVFVWQTMVKFSGQYLDSYNYKCAETLPITSGSVHN